MSARSTRRAREREARREQRRASRRASRIGIGAGGALAAALVVAPGAASAATFTVTKTADTDDAACVAGDADCSLREAVKAANANDEADVVNFASGVTGTIALDASFGHMDIRNESLQIQGPGAGQLTINGGAHDRIFKLFGFDAADQQVVISGLTLTNGLVGDDDGGAILSLDGSPTTDGDFDFGSPGDLTVTDSVISNSVANRGGAIALDVIDSNSSGGLTVRNTTIDGNSAQVGGGVFARRVGENITVTASTFSNNSAVAPVAARASGSLEGGDGGGMAIDTGAGQLLVQNSTFARNDAEGAGGALRFIVNPGNSRSVRNSTIADNGAAEGGGISVSREEAPPARRGVAAAPTVGLSSTIVGDNTADSVGGNADGPDLRSDEAAYDAGFSLIEITNGATVNAAPPGSNITGDDPQLGGLAANGGPTRTKLPATASRAIDAGIANGLTTDQRGLARTVDRPPAQPNGSDATDIGAVELATDEQPPDEVPGPKNTRCLGEVLAVKRGGPEADKLEGTPQRDGIFARGGRDTVLGLAADDCLFGGTDEDKVKGGPGGDRVNGDPDDDEVRGNGGSDDARGQNGDDEVYGGGGDDRRVTGGAGDDEVYGGAGDDKLIKGDGGNDLLDLGSGRDSVHAGGGADKIRAADGDADEIICGTGKDVAFVDPADDVSDDCNTVRVVG